MEIRERILEALQGLTEQDFNTFKWFLQGDLVEGLKPLTVSSLENAERIQVVDKIRQTYPGSETQIMLAVLMKLQRIDLAERFGNVSPDKSPELHPSLRASSSESGRKRKRRKLALTREEKERREKETKLRGLLEKTLRYEHQLQDNMSSTYRTVRLGTMLEVEFENVFIWLYNVNIKDTDIHSHHEVRQMEMNKPGERTLIQLIEMHNDPSGRNIRTVLTVGCAGIGKTFLVHKFLSDWSRKCFPQDPHLVFPLKFRQLNLLKGKRFRLAQLIHHCIKETRIIEEDILNDVFNEVQKSVDYNKSPFKVMFIMDGYDENNFEFDFQTDFGPMNLVDSYPVEHLIVNLIKGELLPSAHIWITSRPAAVKQIPKAFVNRMTEVRGFIQDDQKKEFFMKTISDENQASSIYSHIKKSKIFHTMCEIPVFCWFLARVVQNKPMADNLPKTLVEMFCHFLIGEIQRGKMKDPSLNEEEKEKLIKEAREVLLNLGKLAFDQLNKGQVIFYEKDLKACGLDVNKNLLISDFCTTFFKEDDVFFRQAVYSFIHLSIHEFLAAVYLFHCFTQKNMEVLKTFLGKGGKEIGEMTLDVFLKRAMEKCLKSESGHLELFVRFLHGLSLESNQRLLGGLLGQIENSPEEIQRVINNLKEMNDIDASPDRCINIFYCLMEMNDPSLSQGIQQYLESENRSGKYLTVVQCSALASMLLLLDEVLKELDLDKYNTDNDGRLRLIPAVRNCITARLVGFGDFLKEEHIEHVSSALSSNPSHLRHLDLSSNPLDQYMELLCDALKSPHCRLETLRLVNCWLSERSCELLASALRSNPHLRELDLTFNVLPVSGLENFSGLKTLQVKHGGHEHWTNPHLLTQYFHHLTLDPNTVSRTLRLSDDNREVTWSRGEELHPYPDHQERFSDRVRQVLCTEGLSGGRYLWEVEVRGEAMIGVSYRAISSRGENRGLGLNDHSWSLDCSLGSYIVTHNSRMTLLPVSLSDSNRVSVDESREDSEDSEDSEDESSWLVSRVSVYLDCPAGTLSFYEVSSDSLRHIYTFQTTFTEPLYPGISFSSSSSSSSVYLCEDSQITSLIS